MIALTNSAIENRTQLPIGAWMGRVLMKMKLLALIGMMMLLSACGRSNQPKLRDFLSSDNCSAPCWNGIQPGQTHVDDAKAILTDQEISFSEQMYSSDSGVIGADIPSNFMGSEEKGLLGLVVSHNIVVGLVIPADICVSMVITDYGIPDMIYSTTGSVAHGDDRHLVYLIDGLYLRFSINILEQDRIDRVAILTPEHYFITAESTWEEVKDNHLSEACVDEFSRP